MAEYIEREAAIEYARLLYCKDCNSYNGVRCRACAFDDVMLLVEEVPAADVVEVRHGEWAGDAFCDVLTCKECSYEHALYVLGKLSATNYCPNCGADMRGGMNE